MGGGAATPAHGEPEDAGAARDEAQLDGDAEPGDEAEPGTSDTKKQASLWKELPVLILIALVVAILIKTFLLQAFWIPSASMVDTLEINDRVLVNKLAYRIGDPGRGDIIVFDSPLAPPVEEPLWRSLLGAIGEALGATESNEHLIKRIIALPGETLEIRNDQVYINGAALDEPYLAPGTRMPDFGPVVIPAGHLFMMGDNRESSSDSRRFGPISESEVVGKAFVTVWPPSRWRIL